MFIKHTVNTVGVQAQLWYAIGIAEQIYTMHGHKLVVTSLNDSHDNRPNSLHNKGLGTDLRTRDVPSGEVPEIHRELVTALNWLGFDVVLEKDHIHLEFDPKGEETWIHKVD